LDWPYSRATLELARARKKQQKVDKKFEIKSTGTESIKVEDCDIEEISIEPRKTNPIAES
jgi:hypothetical protein